jgi:hypothetical protein
VIATRLKKRRGISERMSVGIRSWIGIGLRQDDPDSERWGVASGSQDPEATTDPDAMDPENDPEPENALTRENAEREQMEHLLPVVLTEIDSKESLGRSAPSAPRPACNPQLDDHLVACSVCHLPMIDIGDGAHTHPGCAA